MNQVEQILANLAGDIGAGSKVPTVKRVTGTNPAANTEITEVVPSGKLWKLFAVTVSLVQGATQTPQPTLIITDDADAEIWSNLGASAAQSASVTSQYTWAPGLTLSAGAALTRNTSPLPSGLILPAGYKIKTSTAGKGANTDYAAPGIFVAEYA